MATKKVQFTEEQRAKLKEIQDEWYAPEPLLPELQKALRVSPDTGWVSIKHPLVMSVLHSEHLNKQVNESLRRKKVALKVATKERDWYSYIFLHERPWRVEALHRIAHRVFMDDEWWSLVAVAWVDCENVHENEELWREILTTDRPKRTSIMHDEDFEKFLEMPEVLTVYRGSNAPDGIGPGLSWSLDKKTAVWFAQRFMGVRADDAAGVVIQAKVRKEHVIAYIGGRNEEEIVALPELVYDKKTIQVIRSRGKK